MNTIIKEAILPTPIENALVFVGYLDNIAQVYEITPYEGYTLYDNALDEPELDPITLEPTGEIIKHYYEGTRTVNVFYNFNENPRGFKSIKLEDIN